MGETTPGAGQRPRPIAEVALRLDDTVIAAALVALQGSVAEMLGGGPSLAGCYESGRDAAWLLRLLGLGQAISGFAATALVDLYAPNRGALEAVSAFGLEAGKNAGVGYVDFVDSGGAGSIGPVAGTA